MKHVPIICFFISSHLLPSSSPLVPRTFFYLTLDVVPHFTPIFTHTPHLCTHYINVWWVHCQAWLAYQASHLAGFGNRQGVRLSVYCNTVWAGILLYTSQLRKQDTFCFLGLTLSYLEKEITAFLTNDSHIVTVACAASCCSTASKAGGPVQTHDIPHLTVRRQRLYVLLISEKSGKKELNSRKRRQ